jgi:hypothetical protein
MKFKIVTKIMRPKLLKVIFFYERPLFAGENKKFRIKRKKNRHTTILANPLKIVYI